jgi:hypothetical protein
MPKHNNVIANQHFHKKWQGGNNSMRGPISVKSWYVWLHRCSEALND